MTSDFNDRVQSVLRDFFTEKGFHFDEAREFERAGLLVLFYKSPYCKLGFYRSERDGEVNCKVGTVNANNASFDAGKEWIFLSSLLTTNKSLSIEELLARVPNKPKSGNEQLDEIAQNLGQHFDILVKGISVKR